MGRNSLGNGDIELTSYTTIVARIHNGKFERLWNGYSATTMRHINAFLYVYGIQGGGKVWWENLETVRTVPELEEPIISTPITEDCEMQTWQCIGGVDMLYKKVAGFGDYDILEPAIKEIDIMNFQNKTAKECVDVPFTIVGKEKETEEDKQKMEISDSFVTSFAIFVIVFGLIMLKICWV